MLDFVAGNARRTPERQVDQAEHVEGGHQRGGKADHPEIGAALPSLPENFVFGEEACQAGDSGNRQRRDEHGAEGDRDFFRQRAHVAHVLLAAHGVNHRSSTEEEQSFEEGVGEDVEDAGSEGSDT